QAAAALVAGLVAVGCAVVFAMPGRQFRAAGLLVLGLGCAFATARHLDAIAGVGVALVALALAALSRDAPRGADQLGTVLRLLLVGFAGTATVAAAVGRPLGADSGLDL